MSDYPRHLHKANGVWIEVATEADAEALVSEGWSFDQVFDLPADEDGEPERRPKLKYRFPKAKA